jgi:hypothetical protein
MLARGAGSGIKIVTDDDAALHPDFHALPLLLLWARMGEPLRESRR